MTSKTFLYLAPLRGITDVLFRNVFSKHFSGFDLAIAPFINPQRSPSKKTQLLADVFPQDNSRLPIIPQLLNNRVDEFLDLAYRLQDLGYTQLNWNLGCPSPMIANKGRGSGFLPYPEKILEMLDLVLPQLKASLSIKMRLGYRDPSESLALLPRLDDYPLEEIIIHPRLGKQLYKGVVDRSGFQECLGHTSHRVVFNGDITSTAIFEECANLFPEINRWMIGRGVLANPFLAEEIRGDLEQDSNKRKMRIREFHDELCEGYREKLFGPGHLLGKMKQLWLYLALSFPEGKKPLKKIKKARTEQQFLEGVEMMFDTRL